MYYANCALTSDFLYILKHDNIAQTWYRQQGCELETEGNDTVVKVEQSHAMKKIVRYTYLNPVLATAYFLSAGASPPKYFLSFNHDIWNTLSDKRHQSITSSKIRKR